jgi:endonuclease-8
MPEGDSIRRVAKQCAALPGKTLLRATTQGLERNITGQRVTKVEPYGKHLMIDLANDAQIRIHLGMNGRFRRYDRTMGDRMLSRISPGKAMLALTVDDAVYLWIQAKVVEITDRRSPMRGLAVASLGADILADDFDPDAAAAVAAEHPRRTIADVLLDQRIVAGIGNIWKCESCFAGGVDPRTLVADISRETLVAIYRAAQVQMRSSVARGRNALMPEKPTHPDRFAVYSRSGRPCKVCETIIEAYQLGDPPRWTWSCPHCQPRSS